MIRSVLAAALATALGAGEVTLAPLFGHRDAVAVLAGDGDGALATWDGELRLWDAGSGRLAWQRRPLLPIGLPLLGVGGGRVVLAAGGIANVYDRATGAQLAGLRLRAVAVSPDGAWLFHRDGEGMAWRGLPDQRADAGALSGFADAVAAFAADATRAWLCTRDGAHLAALRRTDGGWSAEVMPGPGGADAVAGLCLLPLRGGGEALALARQPAAAGARARLEVVPWPLRADAGVLAEGSLGLSPAQGGVLALLPIAPGRLLAAGSQIDHVEVAVDPDAEPALLVGPGVIGRPAACGGMLAVASGPRVRISADGLPVATLGRAAQSGAARGLMRSPDGRLLWAAHEDGLVCWDLALLQLRSVVRIDHLAGALLPTAHPRYALCQEDPADGLDGPWRLVDLAGRAALDAVRGDPAAPPSVAADGRLAAGLHEGRVRAWLLPGGDEIASAPLPDAGFPPEHCAVGLSGDAARILVARAPWPSATAEPGTPQRWDLRIFELPAMRLAASTSLPLLGGADVVRLLADGDGWALQLDGLRVRVRADGAERGRDEIAAAAPAALTASPAASDGPWYARVPAEIDARGLVVLGGDGAQVHLLSGDGAWAAWSDDGAFDGSRSAARVLSAAVDGRPAALEDAAPWANRPERLLRLLGCDDAALLAAAAKPADRRAAPAAARPEVRIAGRSRDAAGLALQLRSDPGRRIAVRHDGVPVGEVVADAHGAATVAVPLDRGLAAVDVAAIADDGRPGARTAEPVPGAAAGDGRLVAACLGVSRYRQPQLALRFAAKDAIDLALALGDDGARHAVRHWVDEQVTAAALDEVRAHLAQAGPTDTVVLSLAGHGLYVADPVPAWRFLPWDADAADPAATGIPWSRIAALFDGCAARRRLVILDTCESGALEDDRVPGAGLAVAGARGLRTVLARTQASGLAAEFAAGDRSRYVTADLAAGIGAVVLASSRGGEASYESDSDRNGLFTATLLDGLRGAADADQDGWIAADELLRWTAGETARRSGDLQHPTIDRDNPAAGIRLPVLAPRE